MKTCSFVRPGRCWTSTGPVSTRCRVHALSAPVVVGLGVHRHRLQPLRSGTRHKRAQASLRSPVEERSLAPTRFQPPRHQHNRLARSPTPAPTPPRRFHPLVGGSDPPCWRLPFISRPHVHPCRSLLLAPGSANQRVVTLFARWASVRASAHIYAATRHVVGNAQSLTSPRGLTRHPTGRGYAGCCIPTSQNPSSTSLGE